MQVDDGSNARRQRRAPRPASPALAPGESAVFFEKGAAADAAGVAAAFEQAWFGCTTGAPDGFQIGYYTGSEPRLSGSGDPVNLFAADDARLTGVSFAAATANVTFDNVARVGAVAGPVAISHASPPKGVQGAFVAADGIGLGSPGNVEPPDSTRSAGDPSGIQITEVAAVSGSGNSPVRGRLVRGHQHRRPSR